MKKILILIMLFVGYKAVCQWDYNVSTNPGAATNNNLPNIPSAAEYEETGIDLGELNRLLLEKVEELTLYTLQLEERLSKLEEEK